MKFAQSSEPWLNGVSETNNSLSIIMTNSLIQEITLYKSPVPLKEPFVISLGPLYSADNLLVKIQTTDGITGWGECSPFRTIHGESQETGFLVGQYLAAVLKGQNPLDIAANTIRMDKAIYGNSCIKSAFDMALFDISAQMAGLPLYQFLGGKSIRELKTDYTVSIGPVDKMVSDAVLIKSAGFEIIKVKLGGEPKEDIERIRQIREAVGFDIPIRIDANQGWKPEDVPAILEALSPFQIQLCEEPVLRQQFMALPEIRKNSPIPIMADESCCDPFDAERLIQLKACDFFNIKLSKSGGLFKSLQILKMAEEAGIGIQMGGFLESRLGFTAAAHFAQISDSVLHVDFDTPLMFSEDPVVGGILYGPHGEIHLPAENGLGASINEQYLEKLEKVVL